MPIIKDDPDFHGPLAAPEGLDVTPDLNRTDANFGQTFGAAMRIENPIWSQMAGYHQDREKPFDPDYNPWLDVQGTEYEPFAARFAGARDSEDVTAMKLQIDREMEDRRMLDAAGGMGWLMQIGAAMLSPSSLLPGGMVVKGAKGVSIARTALSVGGSAALAAAVDEVFLQQSQQTRTGLETTVSIGGAFILGGVLGSAAGAMSRAEVRAASAQVEQAIKSVHQYDDALRSIGAAENTPDLTLRREEIFQTINAIPVLRGFVRSDPVLRAQLSPLKSARKALVDLVETPLQYRVNDQGISVRMGESSVEANIAIRERRELASAISYLHRSFAEYSKDGPVGVVGTITAPITRRFMNLTSMDRKLTASEFMQEVGKAMRRGDKHPIPQVQSAADALRREIFSKIEKEATELGFFDPDLKIKNAESYFTRVYNSEKIKQHFGDGSENDIGVMLREEFRARRASAQEFLANDRTVERLEADRFRARETARTAQGAYEKAVEKARGKRDRATAAIKREGAVGRATGALRRAFEARTDDLKKFTMSPEETDALEAMVRDARGLKRLTPPDIMRAIRDMGGVRDDGSGELKAALDTKTITIQRNAGMQVDDMRSALEELGYLPQGSTVQDFYDAIRRAANGEDIFSRQEFGAEIARYEAARDFAAMMDELGVDISRPLDEIIKDLPGKARNQSAAKAKAGEAARSARKSGKAEGSAEARVMSAMDRLEDAQARLAELKEEISPKVQEEIKAAREDLKKVLPELKKAKKERSAEEFFANADDVEIDDAVNDAVRSILSLKPGEPSFHSSLAKPTRARVMDVEDVKLEPWLESNAEQILGQYFHSMVPMMEMTRKFGDIDMKVALDEIAREVIAKAGGDPSKIDQSWVGAKFSDVAGRSGVDMGRRTNKKLIEEAEARIEDIMGMRDRLLHRYGVPKNPKDGWVQGTRVARSLSYMGYLGAMMLAAIPDVSSVFGRVGVEGAFGTLASVTDPKRLFTAASDMKEFSAAAEWFLNSRALSVAEMFDPYGSGTKIERILGQGARDFSIATGMIPWNVAWRSVGGAAMASKMAKAADAVAQGKATTKQLRVLAENGIEPWMAKRIAQQIDQFGDKNGHLWLPRGQDWTDADAFDAFAKAMNREFDLMIITPGQDKPLSFSTETGKFFSQFKSFAVSAHNRILLSGIQRADADVLMQVVAAVVLGGLVSNIRADLGGYDRKSGAAFWEDALDRSGIAGWLMEPYNAVSAVSGGRLSLSGEPVSRFQARSAAQGVLGPSVDMGLGAFEGIAGLASGKGTYRDVRKLMRPIPGNNLWYLLPLFRKVEEAGVAMTGAKPRPE